MVGWVGRGGYGSFRAFRMTGSAVIYQRALASNRFVHEPGLKGRLIPRLRLVSKSRRGRLIAQSELNEYTRWLATAVTEGLHYFIGHGCYSPHNEARYLAVTAAHITHMLRDTFDDNQAGYYNIPREILQAHQISPFDTKSDAYRSWVRSRVTLARTYFIKGREYLNRVENGRCRLACYAYVARFEWLLNTFEKEGYDLRPQYNERKSIGAGLQMSWLTFAALLNVRPDSAAHHAVPVKKHY